MDLVSAGTKRLDSNGGLSLSSEKEYNARSMLLLSGEEKCNRLWGSNFLDWDRVSTFGILPMKMMHQL
jgi:hypothetical protein